jgi:hypothetical protein
MALIHAEKFIKEIIKNHEMRTGLYRYDTSAEVMKAIHELGFPFKLHDFEESINHLKTESPTEEQAIMLDEILVWWNMLMFDGSITEEQPACTPAKCSTCSSCG